MPAKAKPSPKSPRPAKVTSTKNPEPGPDTVTMMPPSKWFHTYAKKAEPLVKNKEKLKDLIRSARAKATATRENKKAFRPVRQQLESMLRLVEAHGEGKAPSGSFNSVVVAAAGLLYMVAPGDLVPDWVPGAGLSDDVAVLGMAYEVAKKDAEKFQSNPRSGLLAWIPWKR